MPSAGIRQPALPWPGEEGRRAMAGEGGRSEGTEGGERGGWQGGEGRG